MALKIIDLVPFLRAMADDNDINLQQYTDEVLVEQYLKTGIAVENACWEQGYKVSLNVEDVDNKFYEISPDPPEWMQMLYVTRTALGMREWKERNSFDNGVTKVTNSNIKDVVLGLKTIRQDILNERRDNCVGFAYTTWDDFFTRPILIMDKISEGFR